jgi:hypothetical protein
LKEDGYAEYRDSAFLELIGCSGLKLQLSEFWPQSGPQWDALGRSDSGEVLIVEAKAHIPELFSPPSAAGAVSRAKIDAALSHTANYAGAKPAVKWGTYFYQLSNRLAHLLFLRKNNINARLILLNFLGDEEMGGPLSAEEWEAAYHVADHVLGLRRNHRLSKHITHSYVDVRLLAGR